MSYDLAVFAPTAAPTARQEFLSWFTEQAKWEQSHSYDNPEVSTPELRDWFLEMIKLFPPLNGPFSPKEFPEDEDSLTDYTIGEALIYAAFRWPKEESAYETTFQLAQKHAVGFFNLSSSNGEVWTPNGGKLTLSHSE